MKSTRDDTGTGASSESGRKPDWIVTAIFSEIDSDVPLSRSTQSAGTWARRPNAGRGQRISIAATFGSVAIAQNTGVAESATLPAEGAKPFNDTTTRTETATPTTTLMLDTAPGDVVIEGSDTDTITVSATRIVWVPTAEKAEAALDALDIRVAKEDDTIRVETVATRDMATLDCSSWRIDLKILVPRTVPVELRAQSGRTSVTGLGGGVTVVQTRGGIAAEHNKGAVKLTNLNGAIEVESSVVRWKRRRATAT